MSSAATSSWIQVNLNQIRKVTGIVIQGCPQGDFWITRFKLQHSTDGAAWTDYTADGAVSSSCWSSAHTWRLNTGTEGQILPKLTVVLQFFLGSTDRNTPETQLLGTPVSAQHVRLLPLESSSAQAGLRFDVLGCSPDCKTAARR